MKRKPRYLVVSGIDGSGKTTILQEFQAELEAHGLKVHYCWMRYNHVFVKPLHALARLLYLTRQCQTPKGAIWRHEFYRFPLFSKVYVPLTLADTWLARRRLDKRINGGEIDVVVCDRWANDILIDMAVDFRDSCIMRGRWSDRIRAQVPANAVHVVIIRDKSSVILARPSSAHDPDFELRFSLYGDLPETVIRISNDKSIEAAVTALLTLFAPGDVGTLKKEGDQ